MVMVNSDLSICTFNCRSAKSSLSELYQLCEVYDIICIQEHWLLPFEVNMFSQLHVDFLSIATSAVSIDNDVLTGRPYGGTGILYKRSLSHAITVLDVKESRMTALLLHTVHGPVLLVNVYMPTDYGTLECAEEYIDICAKISVLYSESDAACLLVMGDFNCECNVSSRFYDSLLHFIDDNQIVCSDVQRLANVFTYCSDSGQHTSWIDHILCSKLLDDKIIEINIHYEYQSSDHKPLSVKFSYLGLIPCSNSIMKECQLNVRYDWDNADINCYRKAVNSGLSKVDIPRCVIGCSHSCDNTSHQSAIDDYYTSIMTCIRECTRSCIPVINGRNNAYNVPGWTDLVKEKHEIARAAFLEWVAVGKPRSGYLHQVMCRTRAEFKLALRRCRAAEEQLRADARASQLADKQHPQAFWNGIRKDSCRKVTGYANRIGSAVGAQDVCGMWKNQYSRLYNILNDGGKSMHAFYDKLHSCANNQYRIITVDEVSAAINCQKKNKSAGLNGIYMESFLFAGDKLNIHLSLLFTICVKHCYLPCAFMDSVLLPQVKNKCGDLTDVDNYRAIALSNAETKIFETVILRYINDAADCDVYQFGFKKEHSTGLCTSVVKRTIDYYLKRGSYVFACFVDFQKAFDRVNYWKLFSQMLEDGSDICVVRLLAFWHSRQTLCVYWQGLCSEKFSVGNGTRQGGVLSPYLFTRFVRPLISAISQSKMGCNIGGLFVNLLAYADDMVLLSPSWRALQALIKLLELWCSKLDIICNTKKTVCMIFKPKSRDKHITDDFPCFAINGCKLNFVSQFRYLGHMLSNNMNDDDDIRREIKNLFVRTNVLISRFHRCSVNVKLTLFKTFCLCMYDMALWKYYSATTYCKLKSAYNKCVKKMFGYTRRDSMTGVFFDLSLPTLDTVVHNSRVLFANQCLRSCNKIVQWFLTIRVY